MARFPKAEPEVIALVQAMVCGKSGDTINPLVN
jgi:hypothetical protein